VDFENPAATLLKKNPDISGYQKMDSSSSPIRRMMVKPKRTFLLLLIGAAVIVTVIWSTRGVVKPTLLAAQQTVNNDLLESQNNVRQIPDDNQQKSPMVVVNLNSNSKNVSPNIASYGSVVSTHATQQHHECSIMPNTKADIDTSDLYPTLNFNAKWMSQREYWSEAMEKRYKRRRLELWPKLPLKVIVMPHSHNDPGWLKTYEGYFHSSTKFILDNAVDKLTKYTNMTFIWTEISFLSMWWDSAHPSRRKNLQKLVNEGRFEILTGGWVMTDEANVDLFAMIDQLVEGHQWLLNTLGVKPKSSWSVDPFGHGSAFPYVLKASGVDGMVIMRIHYAWKEWFAKEQSGDFMWRQVWDPAGKDTGILCHNFPYDIYSIKGSCGPQSQTCLQYNFALVPGQYTEYVGRTIPITKANIQERSENILEQWGKTGSLYPHNVVLVPLGDDFTYSSEGEWDQQYTNYNQIIEYINSNGYDAEVRWGTLTDYFNAVHSRISRFDSLVGDFFVYSDVFSEGTPAYWSGYYSTRPYMKKLSRELEATLRSAEILFTWSHNVATKIDNQAVMKTLESGYAGLSKARRNLALFQHHDAITGTAKQFVTHDYGEKMFDGMIATRNLMKISSQYLLMKDRAQFQRKFLESDFERPDYGSREKPLALDIKSGSQHIVVFNSLGQESEEIVTFFLDGIDSAVCVQNSQGDFLPVQFSPTWTTEGFIRLEKHFMEGSFFAKLPPLSVTKFTVGLCSHNENQLKANESFKTQRPTKVFCLRCPKKPNTDPDSKNSGGKNSGKNLHMTLEEISEGSVVISNANLELVFDEETHLLKSIKDKKTNLTKNVAVVFGGYPTMQFRNGAYLFKPDLNHQPPILPIIDPIDNLKEVVIISGHVFSEISLIYEAGTSVTIQGSFVHTIRLHHARPDSLLARAIYMENNFNFGDQNNFRDIDMFMRLETNFTNMNNEWFSDASGLSMQRRTPAVNASGLEGNIYPITNQIYLEDRDARLSLLVDHATAAASQKQGWLEVIVDRRASYDDSRGMGEGILDSRDTQHRYWLLMEPRNPEAMFSQETVSLPSRLANSMSRRLNYPPVQFVCSANIAKNYLLSQVQALDSPMPDVLHLFNLRTLTSAAVASEKTKPNIAAEKLRPSTSALLILHRQGHDCQFGSDAGYDNEVEKLHIIPTFTDDLKPKSIEKTSLTGNQNLGNNTDSNHWTIEANRLQTYRVNFG